MLVCHRMDSSPHFVPAVDIEVPLIGSLDGQNECGSGAVWKGTGRGEGTSSDTMREGFWLDLWFIMISWPHPRLWRRSKRLKVVK